MVMFATFGDARHKIASGDVSQSRDIYFDIYQALSTSTEDVFRKYRADFFVERVFAASSATPS